MTPLSAFVALLALAVGFAAGYLCHANRTRQAAAREVMDRVTRDWVDDGTTVDESKSEK